jgi:NADH-quinone oxidoreductase subunit J
MLTAQGPFINMKTSGAEWAISMFAGIMLFAVLCFGTLAYYEGRDKDRPSSPDENPPTSHHSTTIGQALLGVGFGPQYKTTPKPERVHYLLPFEIVSVHLLVVLIGAAYLARAKKRKGETA